jgi:hypothetical protein
MSELKAVNKMKIELKAKSLHSVASKAQIKPTAWDDLPKDERENWRVCAVKVI